MTQSISNSSFEFSFSQKYYRGHQTNKGDGSSSIDPTQSMSIYGPGDMPYSINWQNVNVGYNPQKIFVDLNYLQKNYSQNNSKNKYHTSLKNWSVQITKAFKEFNTPWNSTICLGLNQNHNKTYTERPALGAYRATTEGYLVGGSMVLPALSWCKPLSGATISGEYSASEELGEPYFLLKSQGSSFTINLNFFKKLLPSLKVAYTYAQNKTKSEALLFSDSYSKLKSHSLTMAASYKRLGVEYKHIDAKSNCWSSEFSQKARGETTEVIGRFRLFSFNKPWGSGQFKLAGRVEWSRNHQGDAVAKPNLQAWGGEFYVWW
jgi:hypothetical protein